MVQYCEITFTNNTDHALTWDSPTPKDTIHGDWDPNFLLPPDRIEPGQTVQWATVGKSIGPIPTTGVEMDMYYKVEQLHGSFGGYVRFYWDMPLDGTNSYYFQAPFAYTCHLDPAGQQSEGGTAIINWSLSNASSSGDGM